MKGTRKEYLWREMTDTQWEQVAALIPAPKRRGKRKKISDRQMVEALRRRFYTHEPWSRLPGYEQDYTVLVKRYTRWREDGTLERVWEKLGELGLLLSEEGGEDTQEERQCENLAWWEVTQEQWQQLKGAFPEEREGGRGKTDREILNVLLYREYTNTPWRELPEEFGPWRSVYSRYARWKEDGTLERVLEIARRLDILNEEGYRRGRREYVRPERVEWWEVTDEQWQRLQGIFTLESADKRGKKGQSDRRMLNGILCKYRTKISWQEIPERYGSWRTVIERYRKWRDDGTMERIFAELGQFDTEEDGKKITQEQKRQSTQVLRWWELTDEQWERVSDLFVNGTERNGLMGRRKDDRKVLNLLLYREYTDTAWSRLPGEEVSWRTVYERYRNWQEDGTLRRAFARLREMGVLSEGKRRNNAKQGEGVRDWWEVTDEQWSRLAVLFPVKKTNRRGRKGASERQMLNAILCRYYTDTPWLSLPSKYGSWRTVIERYQNWRDDGTLDLVFAELQQT